MAKLRYKTQWRILGPSEILQYGDEFRARWTNIWTPFKRGSNCLNNPCSDWDDYSFRRRINQSEDQTK
jgi:hypothetical protein